MCSTHQQLSAPIEKGKQGNIVSLLYSACKGDLRALERLAAGGHDMGAADYDGRTALHLAASEGHVECVQFLVEKCRRVEIAARDRWNHTPHDNAVNFGHTAVALYLQSRSSAVV